MSKKRALKEADNIIRAINIIKDVIANHTTGSEYNAQLQLSIFRIAKAVRKETGKKQGARLAQPKTEQ